MEIPMPFISPSCIGTESVRMLKLCEARADYGWVAAGEGQEKDLAHAINTAFETFKKSKNETVKAQIAEFDPKAEEDKVILNFNFQLQKVACRSNENFFSFEAPNNHVLIPASFGWTVSLRLCIHTRSGQVKSYEDEIKEVFDEVVSR